MTDQTTTPLVDRLRAQAARCRGHAPFLLAKLLEEAAEKIESDAAGSIMTYTVGRHLMDLVFRPNGMTDLHDLQAFLDAVETTIVNAQDEISARYTLGRVGELVKLARDKALLEAEKAVNDRLAAYGLHREKHRSAIAATHMAALAVRRIRIGETPTVYQEFEVVPAGALLAERERCAQIADDYDQAPGDDSPMGPTMAAQVAIAQTIAERIRAGEP